MAVEGSNVAKEFEVSRERQDEYAYTSQQRYARALKAGSFKDELVSVALSSPKGTSTVAADEQPRPETTIEGLARLKPVFSDDGTITAGNAPRVNDGATAILLMSATEAKRRSVPVLAQWLAHREAPGPTPPPPPPPAPPLPAAPEKTAGRG